MVTFQGALYQVCIIIIMVAAPANWRPKEGRCYLRILPAKGVHKGSHWLCGNDFSSCQWEKETNSMGYSKEGSL